MNNEQYTFNELIHSGERLDDLQLDGLRIIQDPGRFCFGMDAVLLSDFVRVKKGERVLDLGTGTGILPLLLSAKTPGERYTGLEIQKESADMARRSVAYNHLEDKIEIVEGDIKEAANLFGQVSFPVITTNPPYMIGRHGLVGEEEKAIARHEIRVTLEDILEQSSRILTERGRFYMVHRPFRLAEILAGMVTHRLEPKRMRLVYPYRDKEPNLVLVEGIKGANSRLEVEPPLVIYEKKGQYTKELLEIYGR